MTAFGRNTASSARYARFAKVARVMITVKVIYMKE